MDKNGEKQKGLVECWEGLCLRVYFEPGSLVHKITHILACIYYILSTTIKIKAMYYYLRGLGKLSSNTPPPVSAYGTRRIECRAFRTLPVTLQPKKLYVKFRNSVRMLFKPKCRLDFKCTPKRWNYQSVLATGYFFL